MGQLLYGTGQWVMACDPLFALVISSLVYCVFITEKYKQLPRRDEDVAASAADQCDVATTTTTTTTTTRKSGTSSPQIREKRRVRPGSLHRRSNTFGFVVSLVTI